MGEKMTLVEVRDAIRDQCQCCPPDDSLYEEWADAIDANLATPARQVDIESVREVIAELRDVSWDKMMNELLARKANKLSQAIGDKT